MNKKEINGFSLIHDSNYRYAVMNTLKNRVYFFVFRNVNEIPEHNTYAVIVNVILDNLGDYSLNPTIILNKKGNIEKIMEIKASLIKDPMQKDIIINHQTMKTVRYDFLEPSLKKIIFKHVVTLITESYDTEKETLKSFLCIINNDARYRTTIFAKNLLSATNKAVILAKNIPDARSISVNYN